jgi:hypothetical protein
MDKKRTFQSLLWKNNLSLSSISISQKDTSRTIKVSRQLYLVFVGYHLKYFYPKQIYTDLIVT